MWIVRHVSDDANDARRGADQRAASLEHQVTELTKAFDESEREISKLLKVQDEDKVSLKASHGEVAASARELTIIRKTIEDLSGTPNLGARARSSKRAHKTPASSNEEKVA
jgi:hypothetical protein